MEPSFFKQRLSERVLCYALRNHEVTVSVTVTLRADFTWTVSGVSASFGVSAFMHTAGLHPITEPNVPRSVRAYLETMACENHHITLELGRPFLSDGEKPSQEASSTTDRVESQNG